MDTFFVSNNLKKDINLGVLTRHKGDSFGAFILTPISWTKLIINNFL
jgi:hypothetical protein